ncbi:50S ribosomal protein L17 [Candidatus Berkelbacteria bacterium RIFCSPLOWO2_01_FULL_50_28]|uniref:50S ribosomal protein L17 n=1 Tax=Candidatus Berkelbacteria bacterium RIFCSPLOWO2_01_FULL_50_28 TaxID=1797471 RepID=A0A1F5EBU3_9BACT|nr:MAG: 50S ribosomal protein L17 [Candidatus Berkelbacteria bacterium RIFCSPHIGHO2_01_FULL_50_36]OGD62246.1 MAG: 50S ribosomal protein L17 [Candidatus Berkelbacteria bacterium RIFCSPHIGHO2_12_FULL_50_11]OGD64889.1 MAG: 50S ribosomal protein L17 [Candidatus Berkelbacteria bacterium RIFCSPLOWO2_01_FULL_50_28]
MERVLRSQSDYKQTMLRNQLTSLLLYEAITTTRAKAKALLPFANRFLTRTKVGGLNAQKLAHQLLLDKNAVKKLFEDILPRFSPEDSNYLRSISAGFRSGDSAEMAVVALLKSAKPVVAPKTPATKEAKTKAKK